MICRAGQLPNILKAKARAQRSGNVCVSKCAIIVHVAAEGRRRQLQTAETKKHTYSASRYRI